MTARYYASLSDADLVTAASNFEAYAALVAVGRRDDVFGIGGKRSLARFALTEVERRIAHYLDTIGHFERGSEPAAYKLPAAKGALEYALSVFNPIADKY